MADKVVTQGNPLSPFLFIIAMEGLHLLMTEARNKNLIKGMEIGSNSFIVTHFFMQTTLYLLTTGLWRKGGTF